MSRMEGKRSEPERSESERSGWNEGDGAGALLRGEDAFTSPSFLPGSGNFCTAKSPLTGRVPALADDRKRADKDRSSYQGY